MTLNNEVMAAENSSLPSQISNTIIYIKNCLLWQRAHSSWNWQESDYLQIHKADIGNGVQLMRQMEQKYMSTKTNGQLNLMVY